MCEKRGLTHEFLICAQLAKALEYAGAMEFRLTNDFMEEKVIMLACFGCSARSSILSRDNRSSAAFNLHAEYIQIYHSA